MWTSRWLFHARSLPELAKDGRRGRRFLPSLKKTFENQAIAYFVSVRGLPSQMRLRDSPTVAGMWTTLPIFFLSPIDFFMKICMSVGTVDVSIMVFSPEAVSSSVDKSVF